MNINTSPFPVLTTLRLLLRALDASDRNNLLKLRSDDAVNKYLNRNSSPTLTDIDDFIIKIDTVIKNKQGLYWVITLKDSPGLIGTLCYYNFDTVKDMAELGYELIPEYQGRGIMQEALTEVIKYGRDKMQLKVISALTHPDNENSNKLLSRFGFRLDETNEFVSKEDADGLLAYVLTK